MTSIIAVVIVLKPKDRRILKYTARFALHFEHGMHK